MFDSDSKEIYTAALIIIGNEILSGRTQDVNTCWIADQLVDMGIQMAEARVVPDVEAKIIDAVNDIRAQVDYVFTTGGIGPTHDDITAEAVAKAFGTELELNREAFDMLVRHYGSREQVNPARAKMAMIPKGASLISNPVSGAPGFQIGNVYVMAGVPRIMQGMFQSLQGGLKRGKKVLSNTVACSLAESAVAQPLGLIQDRYPNVSIGSYPHYRGGALGLNLVLRSTDEAVLEAATLEVIRMVEEAGGKPDAISVQSSGSIVK